MPRNKNLHSAIKQELHSSFPFQRDFKGGVLTAEGPLCAALGNPVTGLTGAECW